MNNVSAASNCSKPHVYLIRDTKDKRFYLGYHIGSNLNYVCSSQYVMEQYNVRPNDFKKRILKTGTIKQIVKLEFKLLKSRINRFGKQYYNANCGRAIIYTDEVRKKISKSKKGQTHSEESKKKMSKVKKGKIFSEEYKKKISEALKGRTFSEEHKKKIGEIHKGKTLSEETKKKISEGNKGKNNAMYGRTHSEETKKKMSKARKGQIPWNKGKKLKQQGVITQCQ